MFVQDSPVEKKKATDFRPAFECLGVVTGVPNGSNARCDCPFCGKEKHFFLNIHTGTFDCKVCLRSGNVVTFMEQWVSHVEDKTIAECPERYDELAAERGIPVEAFHDWGFGWNHLTQEWIFPSWTDKGRVHDVRRWQGRGIYSTDGMKAQLFGMYLLASTADRHLRRVWVCYSDDTEVLTDSGFVPFKELSKTAKVAQYDKESGDISFVVPNAHQKFRYTGEMVHMLGRWADLLVTPDHRVLSHQAKGVDVVQPAKDIKSGRCFPVSGKYEGEGGPSRKDAAIIAAYLADGCKPQGNLIRWNLKKDRKKQRLRELLGRAGIAWTETSYPSSPEWTWFKVEIDNAPFLRPFFEKVLPMGATHWGWDARDAFMGEIRFWDGDGDDDHIRFFTACKETAETISAMAALTGWGCTVREDCRYESINYVLNLHHASHRQLAEKPGRLQYDGNVYCCTVDTGFIIVRRNGKTMVSGNCEGEWDGVAMRWLLKACSSNDVVVAVPGAGTFKSEWVNWFRDCHVVHVYDNDDSGDRGSAKASGLLKHVARRQQFVCWPESLKSGWDVRDQIKQGLSQKMDPADILHGIEELIQDAHRRSATGDATKPATLTRDVGPVATFNEVLTVFKKWVKLDRDFMDCLICSLATVLSNHVPGEPLWTYLIGPSGGGKSLILCAFATSPKCSFHSAFTRTTLLSGFMRDPDPSLLPRLNGLTCVLKEGTEITQMHPDAKRDIYSVLRGAYDGRVDREFGNGKLAIYADLHFNMLIGTTPAVRADNLATVGERFLSIEMYENPRSAVDKLYQVATNSASHVQKQRDAELCDVVARFASRDVDVEQLPKIPEPIVHRIVAMAQLVELLRAQVERDPRDRDLKYRAVAGVGTRVVAQMVKYAQMIAVVLGKVEVDNDVCRILRKIMADTATGFHVDIVKSLVLNKNQPLTTGELAQTSRMTGPTLTKRLEDMAVLKIVEPHRKDPATLKKGEMAATKYALTERVMNLWEQSIDGVRRD